MDDRTTIDKLYEAPLSDPLDDSRASDHAIFYVVAPWKFSLLFWSTLGLYDAYWQYRNWACYKRARGIHAVPVLRGIFSIFFAPSLFARIGDASREAGAVGGFPSAALATGYVVLTVLTRVSSERFGGQYLDLIALAALLPLWWILLRCQKRINAVHGDESGAANHRLSWANWVWIIAGAVFWVVTLWGLTLRARGLM